MYITNVEQQQLSLDGNSIFNLGYFFQEDFEFEKLNEKLSDLQDSRDIEDLVDAGEVVDLILITSFEKSGEDLTSNFAENPKYFTVDSKHLNLINHLLVKN